MIDPNPKVNYNSPDDCLVRQEGVNGVHTVVFSDVSHLTTTTFLEGRNFRGRDKLLPGVLGKERLRFTGLVTAISVVASS